MSAFSSGHLVGDGPTCAIAPECCMTGPSARSAQWSPPHTIYLHSCFLPGGCSPQWDAGGFCRCLGTRRNRNRFTPGSKNYRMLEHSQHKLAVHQLWRTSIKWADSGAALRNLQRPRKLQQSQHWRVPGESLSLESMPKIYCSIQPSPPLSSLSPPILRYLEASSRAPLSHLHAALALLLQRSPPC